MELEKRGLRTITVCTDAFEKMADLERDALGQPDLQLAIIGHPLLGRDEIAIEAAVDEIMPLLEARFGASA